MTPSPAIHDVVKQMIALVPDDALHDLQYEDPASAVEVHYEPVRVHRLPHASLLGGDCSVDGYYESFIDPASPRILYSDDVVAERARFTIIHELGHHIFNTVGAVLLDDLDRMGGSAAEAQRAEESACHQFAGQVLVPTKGGYIGWCPDSVPWPSTTACMTSSKVAGIDKSSSNSSRVGSRVAVLGSVTAALLSNIPQATVAPRKADQHSTP